MTSERDQVVLEDRMMSLGWLQEVLVLVHLFQPIVPVWVLRPPGSWTIIQVVIPVGQTLEADEDGSFGSALVRFFSEVMKKGIFRWRYVQIFCSGWIYRVIFSWLGSTVFT